MLINMKWMVAALGLIATSCLAYAEGDSSPAVRFVSVEPGVKLEVLDWGGTGPALVFIPGGDGVAHSFDDLAPKFVSNHHVYAITRRGYPPSSVPAATVENYDPDKLADDVLTVLATLKIERPVLAGHSAGGQELSSIGARYPQKISGLVYLDAAWPYAFYDPVHPDIWVEAAELKRDLSALMPVEGSPSATKAALDKLEQDLPRLQVSMALYRKRLDGAPELKSPPRDERQAMMDIMFGNPKPYRAPKVPILAIMAIPARCAPVCGTPAEKSWAEANETQANAFEKGNPGAVVVRLPHAAHAVWRSNEADVLREMNAFMGGLR